MSHPEIMVIMSVSASICYSLATLGMQLETTNGYSSKCAKLQLGVVPFVLMCVSGCLSIASLNYGPISLKAGLGVVDIAISPVMSCIFKSPTVPLRHIGIACIGCGMCIFSQFPPSDTPDPDATRKQWNTASTIVFVPLECLIALGTAACTIIKPLAVSGTGCVSAGFFVAIASLLFSTYFRLLPASTQTESGLLITFALVCLVLFYYFLKKGIQQIADFTSEEETLTGKMYRKTKAQGAIMATTCSLFLGALNGVIVNKEADHMDATHGLVLGAGLVLCLVSLSM